MPLRSTRRRIARRSTETRDESASRRSCRRCREARMVRLALEGGGVPQGDEVRLPRRGGGARDRRAAGEIPRPHRGGQLAHLLPHHVRTEQGPRRSRRQSSPQPKSRSSTASTQHAPSRAFSAGPRHLSTPVRHARPPRSQSRSATRKRGCLARPDAPQRHRLRHCNRNSPTMWVIESRRGPRDLRFRSCVDRRSDT